MPFFYIISKKRRLAVIMVYGLIDLTTFKTAIVGLIAIPNFYPGYRVLIDLRRANFQPSAAEANTLGLFLGQNRGFFKNQVAVVVTSTLAYGLARMTSIYAGLANFNMMVFHDHKEVTMWIKQDVH